MPKRSDIKKVMLIGSGPIMIGQEQNLIFQAARHAVPFGKRE